MHERYSCRRIGCIAERLGDTHGGTDKDVFYSSMITYTQIVDRTAAWPA